MTEEKPAAGGVLRWALRHGVGVGILCALWFVTLHLTGNNPFGPKRLLAEFTVPIAVVASQWALRRSVQPGKPGVGRSLAVGGLTAVLAALIAASSLYSLGQGAGPAAWQRNRAEMQEIARSERDYLVKQGGGETAYQLQLQQLGRLTATDLAQNDFSKILLLGLMFALPAGVFFRE